MPLLIEMLGLITTRRQVLFGYVMVVLGFGIVALWDRLKEFVGVEPATALLLAPAFFLIGALLAGDFRGTEAPAAAVARPATGRMPQPSRAISPADELERYRLLLEHLPQTAVVMYDRDLRFTLVAGQALEAAGLGSRELLGRTLTEAIPGRQGEELAEAYRATLAGEQRSLEYRSDRNGRHYWLRLVPLRRPDGAIDGGIGIMLDVTERRLADERRELVERRSRKIIDTAQDAFIGMDADGRVNAWNAMATLTFGYREDEAMGRRLSELIVPERLRERHEVGLVRYLQTRESRLLGHRIELPAVDRGGREFPVEVSVTVVDGPDGRPHFQAFLHDITERKSAENELRRHVSDLDALTRAIRELGRSTDGKSARRAICEGAQVLTGARMAVLFEPDPKAGALRTTAAVGIPFHDLLVPYVGEPSGAVRAFTDQESLFVSDIATHPQASRGALHRAGVVSALWHPVMRGRIAVGVLAVGWTERVFRLPERLGSLMDLVVAEAAVAIERADMLTRLEGFARTDELTGLLNRRAWDEELPREIARARREQTEICVAIFDLDHFKDYNDQHGHQAGDRLLKEAASAWRSTLRITDVLARYGGEEFAIALPKCGLEEARGLVERLRSAVPQGETCSAGVAQWDRAEGIETLVGRADAALYAAKRAGRNRAFAAPARSS